MTTELADACTSERLRRSCVRGVGLPPPGGRLAEFALGASRAVESRLRLVPLLRDIGTETNPTASLAGRLDSAPDATHESRLIPSWYGMVLVGRVAWRALGRVASPPVVYEPVEVVFRAVVEREP